MSGPAVIFIGSGEASVLERKVLIHSLKKNSRHKLDIRIFNGTHNALETETEAPQLLDMPLRVKYANVTEFSNYRFMIPELCGHKGRAIWLDSDMLCVGDIYELFSSDMSDHDFMAKPQAYGEAASAQWGLSVSLFDCDKSRFNLKEYFSEIDQGVYSYGDLHQMTEEFLTVHPFKIGAIDPKWNDFDFLDEQTKLIHYTNLYTQPWKYRSHPYGDIWFRYLQEAYKAGFITDRDIELAVVRSYVRRDILEGNRWTLRSYFKRAARELAAELRCVRARFR